MVERRRERVSLEEREGREREEGEIGVEETGGKREAVSFIELDGETEGEIEGERERESKKS
jgi:hypothetical protein